MTKPPPTSAHPWPAWRPKPGDRTGIPRLAYYAGYSDNWYKYPFGQNQEDPDPNYQQGWNDAEKDR